MEILWSFLFGPAPIRWVQEFFGLGHPLPFRIFSLIGDTWGIILVVGLAFWLLGRRTAYATIGIVILGAATKVLLSNIFSQSRPSETAVVVYQQLGIGSFPSGHVYETVGPWGLLFALGCVPFWVPVLATVLVSLGRIYLGTHFIGDVLGGIFFGVLLVWGYYKMWPSLLKWGREHGPRFFLFCGLAILAGVTASILVMADPHARRFEILGMVAGGLVALFVEHRYTTGDAPTSVAARISRVIVGTGGVCLLLLLDRLAPANSLYLGILTAGGAMIWAVLAGKSFSSAPPHSEGA